MVLGLSEPNWLELTQSIHCILKRYGVSGSDADDLFQNAILRLLRHERPPETRHALGLVAAATHSALFDWFRKCKSEKRKLVSAAEHLASNDKHLASGQEIEDQLRVHAALRAAILSLPKSDSILVLADVEGRTSLAAIARSRGVHRGTIARQRRKAMRLVRAHFAELAANDTELAAALDRRDLH